MYKDQMQVLKHDYYKKMAQLKTILFIECALLTFLILIVIFGGAI